MSLSSLANRDPVSAKAGSITETISSFAKTNDTIETYVSYHSYQGGGTAAPLVVSLDGVQASYKIILT